MPVTDQHSEYRAQMSAWAEARDIFQGEKAVKARAQMYLPQLDGMTPQDYAAYVSRASFFNATGRTADGLLGLVFRRKPVARFQVPPASTNGRDLLADVDLLGTPLEGYARRVVSEVLAVGRFGTLVEWSQAEGRAHFVGYEAENILNWRTERIGGKAALTLLVLNEPQFAADPDDVFGTRRVDQIRVLKLASEGGQTPLRYVVEIWRKAADDWQVAERRIPTQNGKPIDRIPFVFHGPRHSRPEVDMLPLKDVINVNLDHFRMSAQYRHGLYFTALPTAWVAGFGTGADQLKLGAGTAWVAESAAARCGFLEYNGQGLGAFERAMDRDEKLLAVLGSRLLEPAKRVGETAETIELRQSGESSVLGAMAAAVSESLTRAMAFLYWWHSGLESEAKVTRRQASIALNTDYSVKSLSPLEIREAVAAWQAGALSGESLVELFKAGEVIAPDAPMTPPNTTPRVVNV